ncbi:uncharacterized protein LOC141852400 [Brevipalpus obovatus]|uniref:uncharacterized protein LOC141852400 n=1 Tax=Brevipalpus obovatus TaxID=246614 RepID=UPI003D9F1A69
MKRKSRYFCTKSLVFAMVLLSVTLVLYRSFPEEQFFFSSAFISAPRSLSTVSRIFLNQCLYECLMREKNQRSECLDECEVQSDQKKNYIITKNFYLIPLQIIHTNYRKNVISYSLYGDKRDFYRNLHIVIRKARQIFPNWIPRFYISIDAPSKAIENMVKAECELILVRITKYALTKFGQNHHYHGMFWRFFAASDPEVNRYIVRDTDSFAIQRDKDAVDDWIHENKMFHVMRDHLYHGTQMLGGMWGGIVNQTIFDMTKIYNATSIVDDGKGIDQLFLANYVYPIVLNRMTCHQSHPFRYEGECRNFPTKREGKEFVGNMLALLDYNDTNEIDFP